MSQTCCVRPKQTLPLCCAVHDEQYRRALALPADRLFAQFDLGAHGGLLEGVRRKLLPDAALLTAKCHALNTCQEASSRWAGLAWPQVLQGVWVHSAGQKRMLKYGDLPCWHCRSTATRRGATPILSAPWWCACLWATRAAACAWSTAGSASCTSGARRSGRRGAVGGLFWRLPARGAACDRRRPRRPGV